MQVILFSTKFQKFTTHLFTCLSHQGLQPFEHVLCEHAASIFWHQD